MSRLKTKKDWSHLCSLVAGKKKKTEKNGNHFKARCPSPAPGWRHLKVQVWVGVLQLVFWWLPLRYWTGSLAGRGGAAEALWRRRWQVRSRQTEQDLGKVAQHCFCSLFYFGPPCFSLNWRLDQLVQNLCSHHMKSTYISFLIYCRWFMIRLFNAISLSKRMHLQRMEQYDPVLIHRLRNKAI